MQNLTPSGIDALKAQGATITPAGGGTVHVRMPGFAAATAQLVYSDECHEAVRLFAPAPAVMPGQLGLGDA